MPARPHLPHHLSLQRVKSSGSYPIKPGSGSSASSAPHSRNASPIRANMAQLDQRGDHKNMGLVVRVQVVKGRGLAAKDRSGTSDPFLILTVGEHREATSVVNKTLSPEWNQTFEFPITSPDSTLLEVVCWDKDRFKKDYMGQFDVFLEDVFSSNNTMPEPKWYMVEGRRGGRRKKKDENVSGEIQLKFTLFDPLNTAATATQVLQRFAGLVAEPEEEDDAEEFTFSRVNTGDLEDVDEEDDDGKEPSDETDEGARTPSGSQEEKQKRTRQQRLKRLKQKGKLKMYEFGTMSDVAGVLFLEINNITDLPPEKNVTKTSFDMDPFVVASLGKKTYRTRCIKHNLNPVFDEKLVFQVQKHETNFHLNFAVVDRDKLSGNDFVGTVNFPLEKISELGPGFDPDTGLYKLPEPDNMADGERERRRRFRMPMSRSSSQNNVGKISRNSSANNLTKLAKPTGEGGSSNGVRPTLTQAASDLSIVEPTRPAPPTSTPSAIGKPATGEDHDATGLPEDQGLSSFELPLDLKNKQRWEDKHSPVLYIRAKYLPYRALRQQFWRVLLRQYDADESGKIDKVELITMLDTLGSTLHNSTIDGFFRRWSDVNGDEEVLTMDQAVICLEEQLAKPQENHSGVHSPSWTAKLSGALANAVTPGHPQHSSPEESPQGGGPHQRDIQRHPADFGIDTGTIPTLEVSDMGEAGEKGDHLFDDGFGGSDLHDDSDTREEHVVEIHECPICHQPRLSRGRRTTDADIITHIATCASSDWRAVNNLVMAGFVTSSQAQRKWYSKVITKVSYGGYRLGANSANILVQDRITGMINEERMSVYVRLGIRLLYKGLKSRDMENKKVRKLLRSLSFKQGRKYDDPASATQIPGFINFHQLDMSEVLKPSSEFKNFNEFFYRQLKPDARPCSAPDDPQVIVAPADCRSVVFNRLEDAQRIWVKGREFTMERLLGEAYPEDAARYKGGALGIMRLAPQDYHRFHIPVDGVMGEPKLIDGEYYTVNPMAIRSALDVYGENIRVCVPIDSVCHGRVMVICVGAMMVGSTVITRKKGDHVKRAEELGYFKFGGSTLLLLFEPGVMKFDEDLIANSHGALETLVRVGMSIGRSPNRAAHLPDQQKKDPTKEEKEDAKRKIEGSLAPSTGAGAHGPL